MAWLCSYHLLLRLSHRGIYPLAKANGGGRSLCAEAGCGCELGQVEHTVCVEESERGKCRYGLASGRRGGRIGLDSYHSGPLGEYLGVWQLSVSILLVEAVSEWPKTWPCNLTFYCLCLGP